ncbi:Uncharacterised protein [Vibrio cholerae]|nr:Uncharacterised protein [Vibrio cholerae]
MTVIGGQLMDKVGDGVPPTARLPHYHHMAIQQRILRHMRANLLHLC